MKRAYAFGQKVLDLVPQLQLAVRLNQTLDITGAASIPHKRRSLESMKSDYDGDYLLHGGVLGFK